MKIRAKFKGANSLGYENGKEYELTFNIRQKRIIINIYNPNCCEYNSLKLFLNNWEVL